MRKTILFAALILLLHACSSEQENSATDIADQVINLEINEKNILKTLPGTWMEDSVAFRQTYKMDPPPIESSIITFENVGYVYLQSSEDRMRDRWNVINDSMFNILNTTNDNEFSFIVDSLAPDAIKYRLVVENIERKFRLIKIK